MPAPMPQTRPFNPAEVAFMVKMFREAHGWTQETLAELSGLTPRTVQRVEGGEPSSVDSRRALARAFEMDDIDAFNRPQDIPTEEEVRAKAEEIQRTHMALDVEVVATGKRLADLVEGLTAIAPDVRDDIPEEAAQIVAGLLDYVSEYLDCADLYSFTDKLEVHRHLSAELATLREHQLSLCAAVRRTSIVGKDWVDKTPMPTAIGYLFLAHLGAEPKQAMVAKAIRFGG